MTEIRSYGRVFALERRIYRVDQMRLNPSGIPVRGVAYFLALAAAVLVVQGLPLVGIAVRALPWYARYLLLPAVFAAGLSSIRIEGRPFHLAVGGLLRLRSRPRELVGLGSRGARFAPGPGSTWHPDPLLMVPDGSDAHVRRLRYSGPGTAVIAVAHQRKLVGSPLGALLGRGHLVVRQLPGVAPPRQAEVIVLERAARLSIR